MKTSLHQGQSIATADKERGLQYAFSVNLGVFQGVANRATVRWPRKVFRYWHFDLNCGSGFNDEFRCIGSPLAFLAATKVKQEDRYFAGFCDMKAAALSELINRPELSDRCFLFHGNNASLVQSIPDIIAAGGENPRFALGSILSDPNNDDIPLDAMAWLNQQCPGIDFIVNWNSRLFKLYQGQGWNNRPTLHTAIKTLGKDDWHIRDPMGAHRWSLLIGRNYSRSSKNNGKIAPWKAGGFHDLDSPAGTRLFNRLNYLDKHNPDIIAASTAQLAFPL